MISNNKEYKISKSRLAEIESRVKEKKPKVKPGSKEEGVIISLEMFGDKIKEEITQYEKLKTKLNSKN